MRRRTLPPYCVALALCLASCSSTADPAASGDTTASGAETSSGAMGSTSGEPVGSSGAVDGSSGGESSDTGTPPPPVEPGPDMSVTAFAGTHVFWLGWDEGQNMREVDVDVEFPPAELAYASVTLQFALSCPDGACDWWDRKGSIGVVENAGTEDERVVELARFVTPYRVAGQWQLDLTPLRPLLAGPQTLRVFIDTWVGPGHANGNGWIVDAQLDFVGGVPDSRPVAVLPLWVRTDIEVGDPDNPVAAQIEMPTVTIPETADRVQLWSVITGHGQGNANNCAEFCPMDQGYLVGATPVQRTVWRDDCGDNPVDNQQGTWTLSRAGWCPGDMVAPWVEDVTAAVTPGAEVTVAYDLTPYENTCRPTAPVCTGCTLGTGCEYDGGNHTPPQMQMSAALIAYEDTP